MSPRPTGRVVAKTRRKRNFPAPPNSAAIKDSRLRVSMLSLAAVDAALFTQTLLRMAISRPRPQLTDSSSRAASPKILHWTFLSPPVQRNSRGRNRDFLCFGGHCAAPVRCPWPMAAVTWRPSVQRATMPHGQVGNRRPRVDVGCGGFAVGLPNRGLAADWVLVSSGL